MAIDDINRLLQQLESVTKSPPQDEKLQKRLYDAAQKLSLVVESPLDTVNRVLYSPMILSTAQIANYMEIFSTLAEKDAPCTVAELAEPTKADTVFTARILRFLASHGLISQVSADTFESNRPTKALVNEGHRAGMNTVFRTTGPSLLKAPDYFKENKFQNPKDSNKTVFNVAHNADLPAFEWAWKHTPHLVTEFQTWMAAVRGDKTWLDMTDFEALVKGTDAKTPVFVDVGGGNGSQCALLKRKLPNLPGRVILQDMPVVTQNALPTPGVEIMDHNFWNEQPVKGARAYYMRTVLHDWPDEKCLVILKHLVDAMGPESYILIDEMVVPDVGAHPHTTEMDYMMMIQLAAMERTQKQWDDLFSAAGLEVLQRKIYLEDTAENIQVVAPKGRKKM